MVEAEQPHILLLGMLLESLYLKRLDEKAAAALLLVSVLGPPHVDYDLDAAAVDADQRTCTLLRIRFSGVIADLPQIPCANLERHLLLPEALGEVLVGPIAKDGDDRTRLYFPRDLERHRDRRAGREPDEKSFLARHPLDHLVGVLGPRRPVLVGDRRVVDGRHDGALHMLHAFQAVECRVRFEGDDLYLGVVLFETGRRTDEGTARAEPCDEVCHLAVRLLPDLGRRRFVVRARVGGVGVLVRIEVALGVLGVELPRLTDGPVRALVRVGQNKVHAVGAQDLLPLFTGILRHAELHLVAERGADPGVRYPRVSARRIEDSLLWRQRARLLTVPDHPQGWPVLDRSAGRIPLSLAEDVDARDLGRDARQLQERRAADKLRYVSPRPLVNPSNHVGIDYTGWRCSVQRSKSRHLPDVIAERRDRSLPAMVGALRRIIHEPEVAILRRARRSPQRVQNFWQVTAAAGKDRGVQFGVGACFALPEFHHQVLELLG